MKALKMASAVTLVIAVTFVVAFNSAFAQQPSTQAPAEIRPDQSARPVVADAKSMIKQAYEITNNAKSVAEYDQIIDLLSTARQSTPTQASMDYSAKLLSWAYNRRGEAMAEKLAWEVEYLSQWLPTKLGEEDTRQLVIAVIEDLVEVAEIGLNNRSGKYQEVFKI